MRDCIVSLRIQPPLHALSGSERGEAAVFTGYYIMGMAGVQGISHSLPSTLAAKYRLLNEFASENNHTLSTKGKAAPPKKSI